ncbi:MAG: hypothetical protein OQK98_09330 [Gammaproteobacteria bacterium]|nr:hypothetical protein [Gammaproteobacteria bacterium]
MTSIEAIMISFSVVGTLCIFIAIGLMFYIGKTRVKTIDKAVLGYEYPNDSIFSLMLRVPNYGGGFLWEWSAKRSGLKGKIEHFDNKFKRPFIVNYILLIIGTLSFLISF